MSLSERQYERVAQWLDGQDVSLDEAERALAEELRGQEALVGRRLDVAAPAAAWRRAWNRTAAELARPRWRTAWIDAAAAAAAAIVLIALIVRPTPKPPDVSPVAMAEVPIDVVVQQMRDATQAEGIDVVAEQLDVLESDILATMGSTTLDLEIDAVDYEIDRVLDNGETTWVLEEDPAS